MSAPRLILLLVGVVFLWYIVRQMLRHWLGGPRKEELLSGMDRDEKLIERETGGTHPDCPLCGSATRLHTYPHIKVWRCENYPACRGFRKAKEPSRMKFAKDWERKKGRGN